MKRDNIYDNPYYSTDYSLEDWNALIKIKLGKYIPDEEIFEKNKEILKTELINYIKVCTKPEYFKLFEWTFDLYKECLIANKNN